MSRYIVTISGSFTESTIRDMSFLMIPMISDHGLKFHYNEHTVMFHFQSDLKIQEVYSYCNHKFGNISEFVLISQSDSTKICMNDDMLAEFMDLEEKNTESRFYTPLPIQFESEGEDLLAQDLNQDNTEEDGEEEDIFDIILNTKLEKTKVPTLDEILDKICEKGMGSLTDHEKIILSKHSK